MTKNAECNSLLGQRVKTNALLCYVFSVAVQLFYLELHCM